MDIAAQYIFIYTYKIYISKYILYVYTCIYIIYFVFYIFIHVCMYMYVYTYIWESGATLLYEIASNNSLICSGFWMSSSLEDRGWDEASASTANTLWTSLRTIKSFCQEKIQTTSSNQSPPSPEYGQSENSSYHAPVRFGVVSSQVFHVRRKTFIQPKVVPPPQGHQVSKPLHTTETQRTLRRSYVAVLLSTSIYTHIDIFLLRILNQYL